MAPTYVYMTVHSSDKDVNTIITVDLNVVDDSTKTLYWPDIYLLHVYIHSDVLMQISVFR